MKRLFDRIARCLRNRSDGAASQAGRAPWTGTNLHAGMEHLPGKARSPRRW